MIDDSSGITCVLRRVEWARGALEPKDPVVESVCVMCVPVPTVMHARGLGDQDLGCIHALVRSMKLARVPVKGSSASIVRLVQ